MLAFVPHHRGIFLPEFSLFLDPARAVGNDHFVFVSHAHSDHMAPHKQFIATHATALLAKSRSRRDIIVHAMDYLAPRRFQCSGREFSLRLLPSGHVLGSAMALIECNEGRLLYTGDFNPRPSSAVEECNPSPAHGVDILIMETTYGHPRYRFPPEEEVLADIAAFCKRTLASKSVPVLVASALGKSQKLLIGLTRAGLAVAAHNAVHQINQVYKQMGHQLPEAESLEPSKMIDKVVICPPGALRYLVSQSTQRLMTAVATGWAIDSSCKFRYGADAAFPLSNHADYAELVRFVELIQPRLVVTTHGFAAEFARDLRARGWCAQTLATPEQLELPFQTKTTAFYPRN